MNDKIFDTRFVALVLAITFGLIYTRAFENEFFKDIILVAIPSIIGLFGSKYITNRWQVQKIKIERKKEALTSFRNSLKYKLILLDTFALKVIDHYDTNRNRERLSNSGEIDFQFSSFPEEGNDQPLSIFGDEFTIIKNKIEDSRFVSSEFLSTLRLYYKNKKLEEDFQNISHHLKNLELIVEELVDSKNSDDFKKAFKDYRDELKTLKTLVENFENKLIDTSLNEPKF